jgi:hypothetical protein
MSIQPPEQGGVPLDKVAKRQQERLGAMLTTICGLEIQIEQQQDQIREKDERIGLLESRLAQMAMAKEAES